MAFNPLPAHSVLMHAATTRVAWVAVVLLALWGAVAWAVSVP
ncbi:hypothetical protein [Lichenifustis flavocetrariae]|nr:hypothetical protein [Lichenifustis flavocetrariae]